jgi:transcriptional regulator with PAS, ATPase and Fis domain
MHYRKDAMEESVMASKICFISPSPESTILYEQTLASLPEPPPIFEGALDEAETAAIEAIRQGYDILVTPEHNARHLWGKLDTPIVAMSLTALDIARAISRAEKAYGEPVAFFESQYPYPFSSALHEILNCHFKEFVFHDKQDGLLKLKKAIQEGFRAIVGGAVITTMARKIEIPCVPLLPSPEDILRTFQQAEQIASVRQIEKRQEMKFKYVAQYSFSGIIVTDEENKIVVFNSAAEQIFGMPADHVLGRPLEQVIPRDQLPGVNEEEFPQLEELKTLQNKQLMVNRIPIVEDSGNHFHFSKCKQHPIP